MAPSAYVRETSDEELRARARSRVARTARGGMPYRELHDPDDVAWAFQGHEAELAELEQVTADADAARAAHEEGAARTRALQAETAKVLAEQDAERRREAEAEARKRLGWKKDERP